MNEDDSSGSVDSGEEHGFDLLQDSFPSVAVKTEATSPPPAGGGRGRSGGFALPSQTEGGAATILRPGFQVTQGVSYYNLASLYVLFYAHVTQGVPIPAIFAPTTSEKGFDKPDIKFDF